MVSGIPVLMDYTQLDGLRKLSLFNDNYLLVEN